MNNRKLLRKALASPNNLRFGDLVGLVEAFGFSLHRVSGSHYLYFHPSIPESINLQNVNGKAKPYQVRQCLKLIERYNLRLDEDLE
jgi:predicted RNA binding protein YcfA (HicA-like mRNA interferase family)